MLYVSYGLSIAAILVMVVNVIFAFRLRRALIGGEVARRWGLLTNMILFFLFGYIASPLLLVFNVPVEIMGLAVFLVFLFGAVFVLVVMRIIRETLGFMDLLKKD